jgi:hypothetical protein
MRRNLAGVALAGVLIAGGAGAVLAFGTGTANAVSPSPSATTGTTLLPAASTASDMNGTTGTQPADGRGGRGGLGPDHETVSDISVAATAIGISEADLTTALASGQSTAAVAKAHNVDPQKVIDALVADADSEIGAAVTAGTMTQAQADTEKAEVVARVADQVNGAMPADGQGGRGCHSGLGGHGGPKYGPQSSATPSA